MLYRVAALPAEVEVVAKKYKAFLEYVSEDTIVHKDELQSMIDDLYDSEAVIIADGRNESLDYFKFTIGAIVAAGSYSRDVKVEVIGPNTLYIDFYVEGPSLDGPVPVRRIITERNGKVISSRVAENSKVSFPVYAKNIIGKVDKLTSGISVLSREVVLDSNGDGAIMIVMDGLQFGAATVGNVVVTNKSDKVF
jgi:hypothetical protein